MSIDLATGMTLTNSGALPSQAGHNGEYLTTNGVVPSWAANPAGGDVAGPASSVNSEIMLFNGITGKIAKSATGTGYVAVSSGVYQTPSATIPVSAISGFVNNSMPTGVVDGANAAFVLANTPIAGAEQIFRNGILQTPTTDYTIAGATVTFGVAPLVGSVIRASYRF